LLIQTVFFGKTHRLASVYMIQTTDRRAQQ